MYSDKVITDIRNIGGNFLQLADHLEQSLTDKEMEMADLTQKFDKTNEKIKAAADILRGIDT